jgi:hypothetical protein
MRPALGKGSASVPEWNRGVKKSNPLDRVWRTEALPFFSPLAYVVSSKHGGWRWLPGPFLIGLSFLAHAAPRQPSPAGRRNLRNRSRSCGMFHTPITSGMKE